MHPARFSRLRRAVVYAGLPILLGVATLTLSRCTQTADNLTGVDLNHSKPVSCKKQCDNTYQLAERFEHRLHEMNQRLEDVNNNLNQRQENALHDANMRACGNNQACRQSEDARHKAAQAAEDLRHKNAKAAEDARDQAVLAALLAQKNDCKKNCHKQGAGSAG